MFSFQMLPSATNCLKTTVQWHNSAIPTLQDFGWVQKQTFLAHDEDFLHTLPSLDLEFVVQKKTFLTHLPRLSPPSPLKTYIL